MIKVVILGDQMSYEIICTECRRKISNPYTWRCICNSPLTIELELGEIDFDFSVCKEREKSIWRYRELIPVSYDYRISLGEGYTPIVKLRIYNVETLLKLDYIMPTGSFKDRGSSVLISRVKELGIKEVVEDSSGNAGASIAAYSSLAGIRAEIYVPEYTPISKVLQISIYGAKVIKVKGSRMDANKEAIKAAEEKYYASHLWNPFFIEGLKTVAYEIAEQAGRIVDSIILPVGSGGYTIGVYKGFSELLELGIVDEIPRIYGVQAASCTPIYDYLHGEYPNKESEILTEGVAVSNPPRLKETAEAIKETGGDVIVVSNSEILDAFKHTAKKGLFIELTSAVAVAGFKKLIESKEISPENTIILLTGFGLKSLEKLAKLPFFKQQL